MARALRVNPFRARARRPPLALGRPARLVFLLGAVALATALPALAPSGGPADVAPFGVGAAAGQSSTTLSSATLSSLTVSSATLSSLTLSSLTVSSLTLSSLTLSSDTDSDPEDRAPPVPEPARPAPPATPPPGFRGHGFEDVPLVFDSVWHRVGDPELSAMLYDLRDNPTDGVILQTLQNLIRAGYLADDWLEGRLDSIDLRLYNLAYQLDCHRGGGRSC